MPSACLLQLENLEPDENFWRNLFSASNPLLVEDLRDDTRLPFGSSLDCLQNTPAYLGAPVSVKARLGRLVQHPARDRQRPYHG